MLLTRIRFGRAAFGRAAILALLSPGLAVAQAQVEAVPEPPPAPAAVQAVPEPPPAFDMWNLDALQAPPIQLPDQEAPEPPPVLNSSEAGQPPAADASDPCRHFTPEERRLLPSLCGASD
jgi:hypothetical protein